MFRRPKDLDRVVHSRALDRARWLIRDHGDEAEAVIAAKLARPGLRGADRVLYKLTRRELHVLRRENAAAAHSRELALVRPPLRLFGFVTDLLAKRRDKATQTG